jgi:hypothetical protein
MYSWGHEMYNIPVPPTHRSAMLFFNFIKFFISDLPLMCPKNEKKKDIEGQKTCGHYII